MIIKLKNIWVATDFIRNNVSKKILVNIFKG